MHGGACGGLVKEGGRSKQASTGCFSRIRKLGQLARVQIYNSKKQFWEGINAACVPGRAQCVAWLGTESELYRAFSNALKLCQGASDL